MVCKKVGKKKVKDYWAWASNNKIVLIGPIKGKINIKN